MSDCSDSPNFKSEEEKLPSEVPFFVFQSFIVDEGVWEKLTRLERSVERARLNNLLLCPCSFTNSLPLRRSHVLMTFLASAAVNLISEFEDTTFVVMKHNNACGIASRDKLVESWKDALSADPISAFGGVLITNKEIDVETANQIDSIFFEG